MLLCCSLHGSTLCTFQLDDPQYDVERIPQFKELSRQVLGKTDELVMKTKTKRKEDEDSFMARQAARINHQEFEKKRLANLRAIELKKIAELKKAREKDQTQQEHNVIEKTNKDMAVLRLKDEEQTQLANIKVSQQVEFSGMELNRWHEESNEMESYEARKKAERESSALSIQEEMRLKREAAAKADRAAAKRAKAAMALETKKQSELEAKKATQREKEGKAARDANLTYAKMHADRLRWEPPPSPVHITQYAKELREKAGHTTS